MSRVDVEAMSPGERARYEAKRARDFYRYYEPIRALSSTGPAWTDLHDPEAVARHVPFSCPDKALTAFCQLGALRLGARRAMLFFFDSNYAYVLAEATRSLSLLDDNLHDIEDELWLGHTVIPRGFSVCEHTVNIPASNKGSNQFHDDASIVHIINDLRDDTRFCGQPYVLGGPKARFYAGVPITTPRGHNIGAYCILDDRIRNGLEPKSVSFLQEMSTTIMTHLDMVRLRAEHERGMKMIGSLETFIKGAAELRHGDPLSHHRREHSRKVSNTLQKSNSDTFDSHIKTGPDHVHPTEAGARQSPGLLVASPLPLHTPSDGHQATPPAGTSIDSHTVENPASADAANLRAQLITEKVKDLFQRASHLIQQATCTDGILILDASVSTYGGLIDSETRVDSVDDYATTTDAGSYEDDSGTSDVGANVEKVSDQLCSVLGACSATLTTKDAHVGQQHPVPEPLLRRLLRRHPRGNIWSFNDSGEWSSDDGPFDNAQTGSKVTFDEQVHEGDRCLKHRDAAHRKKTHAFDAFELKKIFPNARSLALTGLWDQTRGRWYAGAFVWTSSPIHIFSEEGEMTYIRAFCDVIMAEASRMSALSAVQAKTDFISSISHELRSPLHGILGTVECLQDHLNEPVSNGMVAQIETCSRTLLDIIDHLLDYSKINHYSRTPNVRTVGANDAGVRRTAFATGRSTHLSGIMAINAEVLLDKVTEEVVETTAYSYCYSNDTLGLADRRVTLILDIDKSPGVDWKCKIALGAWKRLCINLVNNALKYTTNGFVLVSLKPITLPGKRKKGSIALTVADSGCGMSEDFLKNHLFYAFRQENPLAEGTGLGLSLVAKIVKTFKGKVDAQSQQGVGTTIAVTMPLEALRDTNLTPHSGNIALPLVGTDIGFIGSHNDAPQDPVEQGHALLLKALSKGCRELGAVVHPPSWAGRDNVALNLITEKDVPELLRQCWRPETSSESVMSRVNVATKPLIVVCETAVSVRALRKSTLNQLTREHIELVAQPCGPERLASAILHCLEDKRLSLISPISEKHASDASRQSITWRPVFTSSGNDLGPGLETPLQEPPALQGISRTSSLGAIYEPAPTPTTALRRLSLHGNTHGGAIEEEYPFPAVTPAHVAPPSPMPTPDSRPFSPLVAQQAPKSTKLLSQQNPRKLSLLLVDDNRINLQLLTTYADKCGHRKLMSSNGLEALEAYKSAAVAETGDASGDILRHKADNADTVRAPPMKPQVVLMDINMPIMDGFEATRQIRAFEKERGIERSTIIALTGLGSASAQHEAYCSGVDLFLTKPVRLKELTRLLQEIAIAEDGQ